MPTKPKQPAATVQPIQPALPELTTEQHQENFRLRHLGEFIHDISDMPLFKLRELQTFKLIMDRDHGCTTPIESFFDTLVTRYQWRNEKGQGMTVADVDDAVDDLKRDDLSGEIRQAHFIASRYPPEPEAAQ
jgi:hypothetical protein